MSRLGIEVYMSNYKAKIDEEFLEEVLSFRFVGLI